MAAVTSAVLAGVGALASIYGQHKAQKDQNKMLANAGKQFSPQSLLARLKQTNPQLYNAAYGSNQFNNFTNQPPPNMNQSQWLDYQSGFNKQVQQNPMAALFQMPGYIDPRMMNYDLNNIGQQSQMAMNQFQGQVGRGGFEGGLADAYGLANLAAQNQLKAQVSQNYNLARTQLMRSDIEQSQNMLNNAMGQSTNQAQGQASYMGQMQPPTNYGQMGSQAISSGLAAYGDFKSQQNGGGGNKGPQSFLSQGPARTPFSNMAPPSFGASPLQGQFNPSLNKRSPFGTPFINQFGGG